MGVKKNKANQTDKYKKSVMEEEMDAVAAEQETKVVVKKKPKDTRIWNLYQKERDSNMRRLKAIFNGTHKRGQKMPDGWKSENYSAPVKKKSKDEEVAEKPAVAKAVKKMKSRQK